MQLVWSALLVALAATAVTANSYSSVASEFLSSHLEPDVVDMAPTQWLQVDFPCGVSAELGNELTPTQVMDEPSISYEADDDSYYTLILTDPDDYEGTDPVYREFLHWLVVNIPGNRVCEGTVLAELITAGPLPNTGFHRFPHLLFKQKGKLKFNERRLNNKSVDGRFQFSTKMFAKKYGLGNPVAGNFFRAEYDDYVPILFKKVGAEDMLNSA